MSDDFTFDRVEAAVRYASDPATRARIDEAREVFKCKRLEAEAEFVYAANAYEQRFFARHSE